MQRHGASLGLDLEKKLLSFAVWTSKFGSFEGAEAWAKPPLALGQKKLLSFAVWTSKFCSFEGAPLSIRQKNY